MQTPMCSFLYRKTAKTRNRLTSYIFCVKLLQMKRVTILLILTLFFCAYLPAQWVSTFAHVPSNGDVAVDASGYVYTISENTIISRISPQGTIETTPFLSGGTLNRGTGLAFDPTGDTLYVACRPLNGQGFITKIAPDGSDLVFCNNLYFPGDMTFDPAGNMYVTEFNNNVTLITPDGTARVYVNSPQFNTPIGIAWTPGDTVYVASAHDGNIFKVIPNQTNPVVQWFAHIDGLVQNWACGFMTYKDGALYITNGDNIIHQVTLDGIVSNYAGSGIGGWVDGRADSCQFQAPNGIATDINGDKLFITEYNESRVREISQLTSNVQDIDSSKLSIYPNPCSHQLNISGPIPDQIRILSNTGIEVKVLHKINQISMDEFPIGVYLIELKYGAEKIYKQFTKI